jgi:hypothetical protein
MHILTLLQKLHIRDYWVLQNCVTWMTLKYDKIDDIVDVDETDHMDGSKI